MKFGAKIYTGIVLVFSTVFLLGGYMLISYNYEKAIDKEIKAAIELYRYNQFVLQTSFMNGDNKQDFDEELSMNNRLMMHKKDIVNNMNGKVAILDSNKNTLYSLFGGGNNFNDLLEDLDGMMVSHCIKRVNGRDYMLVGGHIKFENAPAFKESVYLVTGVSIEDVLDGQRNIKEKFFAVYITGSFIFMVLVFGFSYYLTRPINRLMQATKRIADGNYGECIAISSRDEIGQLANNFNKMSAAIADTIKELEDLVRQKEDFVSNFAHELKTPLTSIIGYSDRIYKKDMPREEQKKAAWYIWNEGMRLEALSQKLMEITFLKHQEFMLLKIRADEMLRELTSELDYIAHENNIVLTCEADEAYIKAEYDLFKTLFLNIVDNAVKAGAKNIRVCGVCRNEDETYNVRVEDDGFGIPESELRKITEAFYMVDKSRARKLHGAGIGLYLAKKITEIHEAELTFESDGYSGTCVNIKFKCYGDDGDE